MHYIYKATNKINGKIYIGQTNNLKRRFYEHISDSRSCHQPFDKALRKYGIDNFDIKIIDSSNQKDKINKLEIYYISKFNSKVPVGYNVANGGEGGSNWNLRPIVMLDLKGNFIEEYDYIMQCEEKNGLDHSRISASCKCKQIRYKNNIFMYKSDYEKYGARKYIKPVSTKRKKIIQYDLSGNKINEYDSITLASQITKIERSNISSCLIKKVKSSGGYIWRYKGEPSPGKRVIERLRIEQYTKDDKYIRTFPSCSEAARTLGLHNKAYKTIWAKLDTNQSCYGFKWKKEKINIM